LLKSPISKKLLCHKGIEFDPFIISTISQNPPKFKHQKEDNLSPYITYQLKSHREVKANQRLPLPPIERAKKSTTNAQD